MSQASDRRDVLANLTDRERDLARALARVTYKLHIEFERSQAGLPSSERLSWPDCWAEAQDGWNTLIQHGLVDQRSRPRPILELGRGH